MQHPITSALSILNLQTSYIQTLKLTNFRSYSTLNLGLDSRPVVLTGPNGIGKTNILEALSFLSPGRGLRRPKLTEVTKVGTPGWTVSVTLQSNGMQTQLGTGLQGGSIRRLLSVDGEEVKSQSFLSELLSVIWLTPQMDRLFLEAPSGRRKFLDRLVFTVDPNHAKRVARFDHAFRERNRLLENRVSHPQWFLGLEDIIATEGVAIAAARVDMVNLLRRYVNQPIGPFPCPKIEVQGDLENRLTQGMKALELEDMYRESLARTRTLYGEEGSALQGPHRSDLEVTYQEKNMPASLCSTGEQKVLLLSIILSTARMQSDKGNGTPLVLLDEVVAHLDSRHRRVLFDEITALGMQAWMTGTDQGLFEDLGNSAQFIQVKDLI